MSSSPSEDVSEVAGGCRERIGGSAWFAWGESKRALSESVDAAALCTANSCTSQGAWASARRGFCPRIARKLRETTGMAQRGRTGGRHEDVTKAKEGGL